MNQRETPPTYNRDRLQNYINNFHRDEDGGAYTLSYVMTIPFLMLLVALIVESTLMMTAKVGTVYSAYAAARTACVWSSAADWPDTQDRIERAATQAMWRARAMNTITANNHLIGEATALCAIQEAWGGPELRLGLKTNTGENRQLDTLIRLAAKNAPVGRYPSPHVPLGLTSLDEKLIRFITDRTSAAGDSDLTAFATLYDTRMTLKRRLLEMLAAKWVANFLFLVPPPIGYGTALPAHSQDATLRQPLDNLPNSNSQQSSGQLVYQAV